MRTRLSPQLTFGCGCEQLQEKETYSITSSPRASSDGSDRTSPRQETFLGTSTTIVLMGFQQTDVGSWRTRARARAPCRCASVHWRALQICTDGQRAAVGFLDICQCGIEIKNSDVTDVQASHPRLLCDVADNVGCGMQWVVFDACRESEMHDQNIRTIREIDELRVGSHLIGAKY